MVVIAQAVDHRNARPFGQFQNVLMLEDARHQGLYVAGKHACHIRNGFAFTEADFARRKVEGIAAHVAHGHIERDARAQAGLLEDHAQHFALEQGRVALLEVFLL